MIKFAFVGGTGRGLKLINALINKNYLPQFAIVLKEDDHEIEKHSPQISSLLSQHRIKNSIKKKLSESDHIMIEKSNLDFIIVYGWRTLIDTKIKKHIQFGMVAAHQSLLPKYRGFAPVQWAIINGEKETGVTLFLIEEGVVDSGKIISQKKVRIKSRDYAIDLDKKLIDSTIDLFLKFFKDYKKRKVSFRIQTESKATYTCKRIPEDGHINWSRSSNDIYNLIRALAYPFTGAFIKLNNEIYAIRKAGLGKNNNLKFSGFIPGRVFKIHNEGIEVLSGNGTVLLTEWENKKTGVVNCPSETVRSIETTLT